MRWFVMCCALIALMVTAGSSSLAQEQLSTQGGVCNFTRLQGKIVDIDWVASTIVVRNIEGTDDVAFLVTSQTKITKGTSIFSLSDLHVQDQVSVEFCDAHFAGIKALTIAVRQ